MNWITRDRDCFVCSSSHLVFPGPTLIYTLGTSRLDLMVSQRTFRNFRLYYTSGAGLLDFGAVQDEEEGSEEDIENQRVKGGGGGRGREGGGGKKDGGRGLAT